MTGVVNIPADARVYAVDGLQARTALSFDDLYIRRGALRWPRNGDGAQDVSQALFEPFDGRDERRDSGRQHAEVEPGVALQILTSGTTGPPKRQDIKTSVLERTVFSVTSGEKAPEGAPPEFAYWQFGGIGVCQLVAGVHNSRRIVMLERFTVDGFVHAIKTHGIKRSGVQPAVVRMLLDADVPKEDLASLDFLISASGPLDPETRDEFEKHFEIPVRLAYGATEFAGSLCAWTPDDIEKFGDSKRNSVGRPLPDTRVHVVDPDTGGPNCPPASRGCWRQGWRPSAPTGSAPPTSHRSTRTVSSRYTAGPTARSTAAASRSCRKLFGAC
jgi:long-chain acyl-CoA synthetase